MKLFEIVGLREDASAGSTASGSIASVAAPLGAVQRRIPDSMFVGTTISTPFATPPKKSTKLKYKNSI